MEMRRTDSNRQYFNLTFSEGLDFLYVDRHYLTFYDSDNQTYIKNGDQFENFTASPNTSSLLETSPLTVYD